jgi:hypothetical protein
MSGAISLVPVYAFMGLTRKNFIFSFVSVYNSYVSGYVTVHYDSQYCDVAYEGYGGEIPQ